MKPDIFDLLADVPTRIVDAAAFTIPELAKGANRSRSKMREIAQANTASGVWEKVWKKSGNSFVPAYRKPHAKKKT